MRDATDYYDNAEPRLRVAAAGDRPPTGSTVPAATALLIDARTDALIRLGQAALELGGAAEALNLHIHDVPRAAFDAFPGDLRHGDGYDAKTVRLDDDGLVTVLMFTSDPEPDPEPDWFAIAQRITGAQP